MWIRIAALSECPPGQMRQFVAGNHVVALANVDGQFYALDGVCPHQGGPLGKGVLSGTVVTCPWHGWQFDVRAGSHLLNARLCQPTFPVRIAEGEVFIDVPSEEAGEVEGAASAGGDLAERKPSEGGAPF